MNITNIFINFAKPETGSFLVNVILKLVTFTGSVALGIVLFTLILKLITLPFDYISRASMRKNSIIMEEPDTSPHPGKRCCNAHNSSKNDSAI